MAASVAGACGRVVWKLGPWARRLLAQRVGFVVVPPADLPMHDVVSQTRETTECGGKRAQGIVTMVE